jgi:hypothetical protein
MHSAPHLCRFMEFHLGTRDYSNMTTLHLIHCDVLKIRLNATRREFHKAFIHMNQNIVNLQTKKRRKKNEKDHAIDRTNLDAFSNYC